MKSDKFSHLYSTNDVPDDSELEELTELLAPDVAALADLDKETKRLTDELERIRKERSEITKRIRPQKAIVSLLRRFPLELMESIFRHTVPPPRYCVINPCDSPLVLLRVCRSWRNIALHAPQLWRSLSLSIPAPLQRSQDEGKIALFKAEVVRWLERSDTAPLTLSVRKTNGEETPQARDILKDLSSEVLRQVGRWESLDLELTPMVVERFAKFSTETGQSSESSLAQLKCLRLTDYKWWGQETSIFHCNDLASAPNLQKLFIWSNDDTIHNLIDLPVNWSNLTVLTVGNTYIAHTLNNVAVRPSSAECFGSVLEKCCNLEQCSLALPVNSVNGFIVPDTDDTNNPQPVVLDKLRSLRLEGGCDEMDKLLSLLELPTIHELHYLPNYDIAAHSWSSLIDLLKLHGHQIEILSFDLPTLSPDAFSSVLSSIPSVKQLVIGYRSDSGSLSMPPNYKHPTPHGFLTLADAHLNLFLRSPNDPQGRRPYPFLEILRCNLVSKVTPDAVLAFLKGMTTPRETDAPIRKFRELSLAQLPMDFPLATDRFPHSLHGGDPGEDVLKPFKDAGVHVNLTQSQHHRPTTFYPGSYLFPNRFSYETDFHT